MTIHLEVEPYGVEYLKLKKAICLEALNEARIILAQDSNHPELVSKIDAQIAKLNSKEKEEVR